MASYSSQVLTEKKYIPNAVIQIGVNYFATRQPDSGLAISSPYDKMLASVVLNPAAIDIKKVNTNVTGFTFRLLDKNGIISNLVLGTAGTLIGQSVTIWLGRSRRTSADAANDFSGYYQLPITKIKKVEHADNTYVFTTAEDIYRIDRPVFAATSALAGDILPGTTSIIMRDAIDSFPASGYVRVEREIFAYTSKDNTAKTFNGVSRGQLGTVAAAHGVNTSCYHSQTITDNPLTIILKLLISGGGLGTYDVLSSGLGISNTLIDVTEIETIRDNLFLSTQISIEVSNVDSALKFIETEILQPFNLRFTYSDLAKLTLVVLDKAVFSPIVDSINENTITTYPKWTADDTKIVNKLKINWDYDPATNTFLKYSELTDATSIATYGLRNPLSFNFNGVKSAYDGANIIADFARVLFARFSTPVPEVEVKTQIDRSLKNIGAKVYVESSKIPATTGGLNFASDMEITKRSINYQTQEVSLTLSFTSFTKIRSAFIAPSDLITYVGSQSQVGIPNGRSAKYRVGWYMRLWNELTRSYEADAPNMISSFTLNQNNLLLESGFNILLEDGSGLASDTAPADLINFAAAWTTPLTVNHRLKFANYSEAEVTQKRYGFISAGGANFIDSKPTYKVTY